MLRRVPASIVLLLAAAGASNAVTRTFVMEGSISDIHDPLNLLTFAHEGDRVVYTYSFDSEAPDIMPGPTSAEYLGLSSSLSIGATPWPAEIPDIFIQHPGDLFDVGSHIAGVVPNAPQSMVFFGLSDQLENNALTSTELPVVPYDLASFNGRHFAVNFYGAFPQAPHLWLGGAIDRFYAVPEPLGVCSMALSLILLCRRPPRTSQD